MPVPAEIQQLLNEDQPEQPRNIWRRFVDSLTEGALHAPIGAEGVVRATTDLSTEELNKRERILSDRFARRRQQEDETLFKNVNTFSPANIGKHAVDLLGNLIGGADPTYVLAPGSSVAARIAAQSAINAAGNAGAQVLEKQRGVRDEIDPREILLNAAAGGVFQGAGELAHGARTGKAIRRGSAMPGWQDINDVIVRDLEGGGTLANPKRSPKGAMGPQQVMPETARKPGFGIRPWDGKSQADLARVGRQYSAAMMDKYDGDPVKVLAAYNAGPGRVDGLIKKWGDAWGDHLPAETKAYVRKGVGKLGGEVVGPENLGDVRLVQDELPHPDEMARINEALAPQVEDILRQADDSNVIPFPTREAPQESLVTNDPFIDVLTPSERQDMDASAPKPFNRNTGAEDVLGKGTVATTPVNDLTAPTPENPITKTLKDIINDEEGAFRPFGRDLGPDESPDTPTGIDALKVALKSAKKAGPEQRKLRREELKKRVAEGIGRSKYTEGETGLHAEKGALKGALPRVDIEPLRGKITDEEFTGILENLKTSKKLAWFESLNARDAMVGLMDGKLPTKSEMALLYRVYPDLVKEILKKRPWPEKAKELLLRAFETSRSQMGSGDVSFGGRQGLSMISRPEYWKATLGELKSLSPTEGDKILSEQTERIVNSPHYERAKEAGLHLMDLGEDREEYAPHGLIENIPIIGEIPKMSNRAYTFMANELRFSTFSNFLDRAEAAGKDIDDPAFLKAAGEWVNTFTGRGQFGKGPIGNKLNAMMPGMSLILFAPRFVLSTFQRLNPLFWGRMAMQPMVAKEALRDAGAHIAFVAGVLGIANAAGYEVEWDPRNPTGLKIKKGNVTRDVGGGMVQTINFLAKMVTNEKITGKGEEQSLRDPEYGGDTNWDTLARFVRTKLHPTLGYLVNAKEGENVVGRKFNWIKDTAELLTPMYGNTVMESVKENAKTNPEESVVDLIGALFGMGLSNYKPPEKAKKSEVPNDIKDLFDEKKSQSQVPDDIKEMLGT